MSKAAKKMAHTCYNYKTGKDPTDRLTIVWNKIQTKFECCGINSYQDWKNSTFGKTGIIPIYKLHTYYWSARAVINIFAILLKYPTFGKKKFKIKLSVHCSIFQKYLKKN